MKGAKPKTLERYIEQYGEKEGEKRYNTAQRRLIGAASRITYTGPKVKCQICDKELSRITGTHLKKCAGITTVEYQNMFPGAEIIPAELMAMYSQTEEKYLEKYGPVRGAELWKSYCDKQAETNTFEYKQLHYGWTREQFDEYNKSRATTLVNMIRRHGEENGTRMFEEYCEKQRYSTTLDYFIEEYGVEEGTMIYNNFVEARSAFGGQSMAEVECYGVMKALIPDLVLSVTIVGAKVGAFDFGCHTKKKLFEFNGDFWHANPKKYGADEVNSISKKTSFQIWEHDARKKEKAISQGYDVYVIWENDFRKDPEGEVEKAVAWFNS